MKLLGRILTYIFAIVLCGGMSGFLVYIILNSFSSMPQSTNVFISYGIAFLGGLGGLRWARKPEKFWGEFIDGIISNIWQVF